MVAGPALLAHGLSKRYGTVMACEGIDLAIEAGEIRALLGENGAGKSTLMRMLYGLERPDQGRMRLGDLPYAPRSARDAIAAGIGMVHQELMLFPSLTVAENIVLGSEPRRRGFIGRGLFGRGLFDRPAATAATTATARRFGLDIDPEARVDDLSIGVRQRVEILKILHRDARVLILDEPTAVLGPAERDSLFAVLRGLAAGGRTILFISHKLDEVKALADRATVLRHGAVVDTVPVAETTPAALCRLMVGRASVSVARPRPVTSDRVVLDVGDLSASQPRGQPAIEGINLRVHAGEIVGVAGVAGNGQKALVETIAGLRTATSGHIRLAGDDGVLRDVTTTSISERRTAGLAWIAEDRGGRGLALDASVSDNVLLGATRDPAVFPVFPRGIRAPGRARAHVRRLIDQLGIKVADVRAPARALSGGNQQKLVAVRELDAKPRLLLAEQPSRGIDVAAAATLYGHLRAACDEGAGILLVASELEEILALSHRVVVLRRGRIVGILAAAEATEERLALMMAGESAA